MKTNVPTPARGSTHEGAPPPYVEGHLAPLQRLRRTLSACLLWEDQFYEDGASIAERLASAAAACSALDVAALVVEARTRLHLRHAPLLLLLDLVYRRAPGAKDVIAQVLQRADEMAELLALYWKEGRKPLAKQLQRGLALALRKFDEYQLAKYDRPGHVKLRDVLFLSHAKPRDEEQAAVWQRLARGELKTPDTWEVALSAGADKKTTFERLLREQNLGYLALLRNLRNMEAAGVDRSLVEHALVARKGAERVLPFRYVAALRHAPSYAQALDQAFRASLAEIPPLAGMTVVLVDVSCSMDGALSGKSDMRRADAAAALGALVRSEQKRVFTFSNKIREVPCFEGLSMIEAIRGSQRHSGTYLGQAVTKIQQGVPHDRIIVVTDEQSHDAVPGPHGRGYLINVASYRNGVGYGPWTHIDGFSEGVLRYLHEIEQLTPS